MKTLVTVVPYDLEWPTHFERERALLAAVFRGTGAIIEHVGSTAVPGLTAKPIIDILLGASSLLEVEARIPELEAQGYQYVPEYESELPERRYLRKPRVGTRTRHLHCVLHGSGFWNRHLAFRDFLRAHSDTAAAYSELKRRLAATYREDRAAYTNAKSAFIESVLEKAASGGGGAA